MTVGVLADESPTGWLVEVSPAPAVVMVARRDEVADRADVRLDGPAVAVYLTLWNRSDELDLEERPSTPGGPRPSRGGDAQVTIGSRPELCRTPGAKSRRTAMTPHSGHHPAHALAAALLALTGLPRPGGR